MKLGKQLRFAACAASFDGLHANDWQVNQVDETRAELTKPL